MLSKWTQRGAQLFAAYLLTHLIVIVMDNRRITDQTHIKTKKISDGPLIARDPPGNVNEKEDEGNGFTYVLFASLSRVFFNISKFI